MIGIYRIRNIVNNKCYYGSSKNINRRWTKHKSQLNHNRHENVILQRAWNKYGEDNFIFEIIEECTRQNLLITEQKYLDSNPEYNIGLQSSGGDNLTNHPDRELIIKKITKTINNNINLMSDNEKKTKWSKPKESNPNWRGGSSIKYCKCGKEIQPVNKTCSQCRDWKGENNPFYNKTHSKETINHISEVRKGKYYGNQNIKFIIDGKEYKSLGDASKQLNIPTTTIRWRLISKNEKFKNYKYFELQDYESHGKLKGELFTGNNK